MSLAPPETAHCCVWDSVQAGSHLVRAWCPIEQVCMLHACCVRISVGFVRADECVVCAGDSNCVCVWPVTDNASMHMACTRASKYACEVHQRRMRVSLPHALETCMTKTRSMHAVCARANKCAQSVHQRQSVCMRCGPEEASTLCMPQSIRACVCAWQPLTYGTLI